MGGARLYGFTEADFQKADKAAGTRATATEPQKLEIGVVGSRTKAVTEKA